MITPEQPQLKCGLQKELWRLATAPTIAPSFVYANACRDAHDEIAALRAMLEHLQGASAIMAISRERQRQINAEGWTPEHDDAHDKCELAKAAACYAIVPSPMKMEREWIYPDKPGNWPWHYSWWKPRFYRENLVKAGALIVAEIDRWDRLKGRVECQNCHNANKCGDYEGPTCEVCMGDGFISRTPAVASTTQNIHNEPCDCPKGQCAHFVDNDADCIKRLPDAAVMACKTCLSMTWHSAGVCQRCLWLSSQERG